MLELFSRSSQELIDQKRGELLALATRLYPGDSADLNDPKLMARANKATEGLELDLPRVIGKPEYITSDRPLPPGIPGKRSDPRPDLQIWFKIEGDSTLLEYFPANAGRQLDTPIGRVQGDFIIVEFRTRGIQDEFAVEHTVKPCVEAVHKYVRLLASDLAQHVNAGASGAEIKEIWKGIRADNRELAAANEREKQRLRRLGVPVA